MRDLRRIDAVEIERLKLDDTNPLSRAKLALRLDDPTEAARQWAVARERHPAYVMASNDLLDVLLGLRLFDEAEALLSARKKRNPRDPKVLEGFGSIAEGRGDIKKALQCWARYRRKFPEAWQGWVSSVRVLREAKRLDEAEKMATRTVRQFPDSLVPRLECARVAEARQDWEAAVERWTWVADKFQRSDGAIHAAWALEKLGRPDEAIDRLIAARRGVPTDQDVALELKRLTQARSARLEGVDAVGAVPATSQANAASA